MSRTAEEAMLIAALEGDLDELNGDGFLIHHRHKEMIANLLIERGWVKTLEANDDL